MDLFTNEISAIVVLRSIQSSLTPAFKCLSFVAALFALAVTFPVASDQNDPKLDELFQQLLTVQDQQTGDSLTDEIWAIWRDSGNPDINALMSEGITAMQSGRLNEAVRVFDQIVEMAPDFAEGWNKRATVYFFLSEYERSAADVRETLLLEPRHFGATAGLGLIFLEIQHFEGALEAFERALEINPHLIGPKMQIRRIKQLLLDDPA